MVYLSWQQKRDDFSVVPLLLIHHYEVGGGIHTHVRTICITGNFYLRKPGHQPCHHMNGSVSRSILLVLLLTVLLFNPNTIPIDRDPVHITRIYKYWTTSALILTLFSFGRAQRYLGSLNTMSNMKSASTAIITSSSTTFINHTSCECSINQDVYHRQLWVNYALNFMLVQENRNVMW